VKFCMGVGVHDVVTHANFEGAGVEFPTFPLTCVVVPACDLKLPVSSSRLTFMPNWTTATQCIL